MRSALVIVLSLLCAPALGQVTFTPLGRLPGGTNGADATGISADAQVVVGSSGSFLAYNGESTRWTPEDGLQGLGLIGGFAENHAADVSPDGGWIVGVASLDGISEAYIWNEDTGGVLLGGLGGPTLESRAFGVSSRGQVVVGNSRSPRTGQYGREAFRWTPDEGMVGLGFLDDNNPSSSARAVSADGSKIVGYSDVGNTSGEAFLWTEQDGMVGLGNIPGGLNISLAYAISDNGKWIAGEGNAEYDDGVRAREAVIWNEFGQMIRLGQLGDDGSRLSHAMDISDDGRVVVGVAHWSGDAQEGYGQAMIWTPEWGMRRLEEVLLTEYGLDVQAMGWRLDSALGVTPDGQYIIGNALSLNGVGAEGFLVRIPTPSTLIPLALAGLLAAKRRRGAIDSHIYDS